MKKTVLLLTSVLLFGSDTPPSTPISCQTPQSGVMEQEETMQEASIRFKKSSVQLQNAMHKKNAKNCCAIAGIVGIIACCCPCLICCGK